MIQSLSVHTPTRTTPVRAKQARAEETPQLQDSVSISSHPASKKQSGWLSSLKKTAMITALAACLAGPLAGTAQAQCQTMPYYPNRPVAVQTMPYYPQQHPVVVVPYGGYRHQHHHQQPHPSTTTQVGISIGPGGVQIQAGVFQNTPWGHQPRPQQPPVVIIQQPVVVAPHYWGR